MGRPGSQSRRASTVSVGDDWNTWKQFIPINAHEIDCRPGDRNDHAEFFLRISTAKKIVNCRLGLSLPAISPYQETQRRSPDAGLVLALKLIV